MGAACSRETKKKNKYIVTKDTGVRKSETVHHNLGSKNSNPQIQVPRRRSSAVQKLVKQSSVFRTRTAALSQALTTSTESIHKVYHIEPNPIGTYYSNSFFLIQQCLAYFTPLFLGPSTINR